MARATRSTPETEKRVPPPDDELETEHPLAAPSEDTAEEEPGLEDELLTSYPDRREWEADVSERAREEIHEGNRPKRH
jgi:hypothetical protein